MEAFAFKTTKDRKVFISWQGRPVVTLRGKEAQAFLVQIKRMDGPRPSL